MRSIDTSFETPFDPAAHARSVVGRRYRVDDFYEVGREKVREYAGAVQDFHPIHWNDQAAKDFGYAATTASPTFTCLLGGMARRALTEILAGYDLTASVQTDQVYEFHRPIVVGDRLTANLSLHSFRQAFGGDLLVIEIAVTNQLDEAVVTTRTSLIARSGRVAADTGTTALLAGIVRSGPQPPRERLIELPTWRPAVGAHWSTHARALHSVAAGDELPGRTVSVALGDLVHYAGVAEDPNPIHWHIDAARLFGLERGVVAHGMLTMAYGAGFITSWLGDPGALRQYSVRMTSPVYVADDRPSSVEFSGRVKSVDPDAHTATVALTALHNGRKIFGRATAVVQLS
ncbi:fused (3R)-hydroxyacyl-ACP dehydratase subunits HadA/HadB [Nocardia sp. IFM 10818]